MRSLKASPLVKPFLTPGGWQEEKCVYWNVSVGLTFVRTLSFDSFFYSFALVYKCVKESDFNI